MCQAFFLGNTKTNFTFKNSSFAIWALHGLVLLKMSGSTCPFNIPVSSTSSLLKLLCRLYLDIPILEVTLCQTNIVWFFFFFFAEVPAVVVGVVGMGHVPGIEKNWEKQLNINEIMRYVTFLFWQYSLIFLI